MKHFILFAFVLTVISTSVIAGKHSQDYKHPNRFDNLHKKNDHWRKTRKISKEKHRINRRQIKRYKEASKIMKDNVGNRLYTGARGIFADRK